MQRLDLWQKRPAGQPDDVGAAHHQPHGAAHRRDAAPVHQLGVDAPGPNSANPQDHPDPSGPPPPSRTM